MWPRVSRCTSLSQFPHFKMEIRKPPRKNCLRCRQLHRGCLRRESCYWYPPKLVASNHCSARLSGCWHLSLLLSASISRPWAQDLRGLQGDKTSKDTTEKYGRCKILQVQQKSNWKTLERNTSSYNFLTVTLKPTGHQSLRRIFYVLFKIDKKKQI